MKLSMKFEEWWYKHDHDLHHGKTTKKITQEAWNAATSEERQRCREIVKEVASASSIIGIGVANKIADEIGE